MPVLSPGPTIRHCPPRYRSHIPAYSGVSWGTTDEMIDPSISSSARPLSASRADSRTASSSAVWSAAVANRQCATSSFASNSPRWLCVFPTSIASSIRTHYSLSRHQTRWHPPPACVDARSRAADRFPYDRARGCGGNAGPPLGACGPAAPARARIAGPPGPDGRRVRGVGALGDRGDCRSAPEVLRPQGDDRRQPPRQPHQGHAPRGRHRRPGRPGHDPGQRRPRHHLRRRRATTGSLAATSRIGSAKTSRSTLIGGPGNDNIHGSFASDFIVGDNASRGNAIGRVGRDHLDGDFGNDHIVGDNFSRSNAKGGKHDWLRGQKGDDTMIGDSQVTGSGTARGGGNDHFDLGLRRRLRGRRQLLARRARRRAGARTSINAGPQRDFIVGDSYTKTGPRDRRRPRSDPLPSRARHGIRRQLRRHPPGASPGRKARLHRRRGRASTTCSGGPATTPATGAAATTTRRASASSCSRSPSRPAR